MMKERYIKPLTEIIETNSETVISASGQQNIEESKDPVENGGAVRSYFDTEEWEE